MVVLGCGWESNCVAAIYRLATVEVGESVHYRNLTIFPLTYRYTDSEDDSESKDAGEPRYDLLSDAVAAGTVEVEETSDAGEVPFLTVVNQGTIPVLIPEGEVLIGAKQNRAVNLSILIGAKGFQKMPVSCVEQGRWHKISERFEPAAFASPKLREQKVRSTQKNLRERARPVSDQGAVWGEVAEQLHALEVESPTFDYVSVLKGSENRLSDYRENLRLPEGSNGFIAVTGETVLGGDLFDSSITLQKLWPRLSEAYFLEALRREVGTATDETSEHEAPPAPKDLADEFLRAIADGLQVAEQQNDTGTYLELPEESPITASVLCDDNQILHLAAFGQNS